MGALEDRFDRALAAIDDALVDWDIVKDDLDPAIVDEATAKAEAWFAERRANAKNTGD